MSNRQSIRCFEYVNHSYDRVRDAFRQDALGIFQRATSAAANRARSLSTHLRAEVGGLQVGTEIAIEVLSIEEELPAVSRTPITRLKLRWEAARSPGFFPLMEAELRLYPLPPSETQLDFSGTYRPPFGPLGKAIDTAVGHRIAEASIHRFVQDVADYLKSELTS